MNEHEEMGLRVKKFREARGLSHAGLAGMLSARGLPFHPATIYKIENGARKVLASEVVALSNALGVPPGYLLGIEADRSAIISVGARLEEARRALHQSSAAYAQAMFSFGSAADAAPSLDANDEHFANESLIKQTPSQIASLAVNAVESTSRLHRTTPKPGGYADQVLDALRADHDHFYGRTPDGAPSNPAE